MSADRWGGDLGAMREWVAEQGLETAWDRLLAQALILVPPTLDVMEAAYTAGLAGDPEPSDFGSPDFDERRQAWDERRWRDVDEVVGLRRCRDLRAVLTDLLDHGDPARVADLYEQEIQSQPSYCWSITSRTN